MQWCITSLWWSSALSLSLSPLLFSTSTTVRLATKFPHPWNPGWVCQLSTFSGNIIYIVHDYKYFTDNINIMNTQQSSKKIKYRRFKLKNCYDTHTVQTHYVNFASMQVTTKTRGNDWIKLCVIYLNIAVQKTRMREARRMPGSEEQVHVDSQQGQRPRSNRNIEVCVGKAVSAQPDHVRRRPALPTK